MSYIIFFLITTIMTIYHGMSYLDTGSGKSLGAAIMGSMLMAAWVCLIYRKWRKGP